MKKITKTLVAILLVAIMCMANVTAFASNEAPSPRLSHTSDGSFTFVADKGIGHADVTYYGYDSFVRADLTVKIEKRFLLVFWNYVDEWSASSTELNGDFYHAFTLSETGMYRAKFTLTITGNDGTQDVITSEIESKYQ